MWIPLLVVLILTGCQSIPYPVEMIDTNPVIEEDMNCHDIRWKGIGTGTQPDYMTGACI